MPDAVQPQKDHERRRRKPTRRLPWLASAAALCALLAGVAVAAPAGVGTLATGVPPGGGPAYDGSLTQILSPSGGAVLAGGQLTVRLRTRAPLPSLHVSLNGREITRELTRARAGVYGAVLHFGGPLHLGGNLLTAATASGGHFDFDFASFRVARTASGLVGLDALRVGQGGEPVTLLAGMRPDATLRAWMNGRPITAALSVSNGNVVGRLGGDDGVRHGRNQLVMIAYTASQRQARVSSISRVFQVPNDDVIAGAGPNQTVAVGQFVRLSGAQSQLGTGNSRYSFRWQIAQSPPGSKAALLDPSSEKPGLTPDVAGTFRVRLTLAANIATRRGSHRRPGAATTRSTDVVTVTAQPSSPYGVALQTNADGPRGGIKLGGVALPGTVRRGPGGFSYAVLNRTTLEPEVSGEVQAATISASLDKLLEIARQKQYTDGRSLMVFNFTAYYDASDRAKFAALFKQVGGGNLPAGDNFTQGLPGSVIGIPGAPSGVAFINHRDVNNLPNPGDMSGYLRLNDVSRLFDFVFTDSVPVDTAASQTATETKITIGGATYTGPHPAGVSGFQMLRLDPKTLAPLANFTYVTNSADGRQQASEQTRLANDLAFSTTQVERPLVILQSYGEPTGYSGEWDRAALAIEKLGGTRQVFDDLNQPNVGGDDEQGRKGGYAFIGRVDSSAPRAEVSYPLDGLPARLAGLLMRTRSGDYEPMLVSAARPSGAPPVNEEFVRIANQPPTPFPVLAPTATRAQAQAAEDFLGGPQVMGVCQPGAPCNVRQTYYTNYGGSWGTIATALQNAKGRCENPPAGVDSTACEKVREQLFDEVQAGNRVRHYLGPEGLQQPFGAAGVAALANLGQISDTIQRAVNPPPAENTTSKALNIVSFVLKIGSLAGAVYPPAGAVASGLGAVFGLAGYLTKNDNGPNVIGPEVQTAASNLGVELAGRYQSAGDQLDGLGRIIVSDYGKLNAVAAKVDSDPSWILGAPGNSREGLIRAAKQAISETLIPKAWPVLYDLGYPTNRVAREWNCYYVVFVTKHKFLFADEPDGGQVGMRFPRTNWNPVMAIGGVHATGSTDGARIPTPPATVVNPLFESTALGGLGLKKLEFFSPTLFRLFPSNPERTNNERVSLGADTGGQGYRCMAIPDPPGNSS